MAAMQSRLLEGAAEMVAPGGILVYSVCSLEREECEARIEALLQGRPRFERVPVTPDEVGGFAELVTEAGDLRTLPCHLEEWGGLDGFYAVRLRRIG